MFLFKSGANLKKINCSKLRSTSTTHHHNRHHNYNNQQHQLSQSNQVNLIRNSKQLLNFVPIIIHFVIIWFRLFFIFVNRIHKMLSILRWRPIQADHQQQCHWLHNLPVQNKIHLRTKIIIIIIQTLVIITIVLPVHQFRSDFMLTILVCILSNHSNR